MNPIMTPVLLVVALGFIFAVVLTIASKVFYVPVDETVIKLTEALPGANCGGCGFAGCSDYANALAADPDGVGPNKCPVGGADVAAQLLQQRRLQGTCWDLLPRDQLPKRWHSHCSQRIRIRRS